MPVHIQVGSTCGGDLSGTYPDPTVVTTTISLGDPTTDGSWRIVVSGSTLSFQRRESSAWVEKGSMTSE